MATYNGHRLARRRSRARRWDSARPIVFLVLVTCAAACVLWLGHLAGVVA